MAEMFPLPVVLFRWMRTDMEVRLAIPQPLAERRMGFLQFGCLERKPLCLL